MSELRWDGKYRDGKRVAPVRIALPFQTVETVNESTADRRRTLDLFAAGRTTDWRNRLIWGDKKYVLPSLLDEFAGKVNLIYIDPPFDTGADFSFTTSIPESGASLSKEPSVLEQKAYRDIWGRGLDSYLAWFCDTASLLKELLEPNGLMFVHLDDNVVHEAKLVLDELFGREKFRGEIIWQLGTGAKSRKFFSIQHNTLLVYSSGESWTFDHSALIAREPFAAGSLATHFQRRDETGRQYRVRTVGSKDYKYYADEGRLIGSVWTDISSMTANSPIISESTGYPTQKPEKLLERIVTVCSRPNDLVLDCFCGSGTTAAVSEKLGRRWIVCDLGRFAIHTTRKRLLATPGVRPFVVQNLGKYERQAWMSAEFKRLEDRAATEDAYRRFILELFHAEPLAGSLWVHGVKAGRMVHVGAVDAPVTLEDVRSIAREVWSNAGATSPSAAVDVLGWDFAFELNETARQVAAESRVDVKFRRIPRDVLDKRAVEAGDVHERDFFELRALSLKLSIKERMATLELTDFILPADDLPADVASSVKHWSQWIDYWAVDWDYRNDTFHNEWQTYRTREAPKLALKATQDYKEPGTRVVVVKVIDLLGNDTTKRLDLKVE
jgi:adenine-specific DNA-methyltransferase